MGATIVERRNSLLLPNGSRDMGEHIVTAADGTALSITTRDGEGPPVVLVHGAVADGAAWRAVAEAIDLPNPVVVVNRRGRAPSGPLGPNYSLQTEIDDLLTVLDGRRVHLFGHSYGAVIALEAAVRGADLLSLTAYDPVVAQPFPFGGPALPTVRAAVERGDHAEALEIINRDVSRFSADYAAEFRASPDSQPLLPLMPAAAAELEVIDGFVPDLAAYGALTTPATLVLGERNEGLRPYGVAFDTIAQAMPRARVVRLPGEGHLAHVTAPHALAAVISATVLSEVRSSSLRSPSA